LLFISTAELNENISQVLNEKIRKLAVSRYPGSFRNESRPLSLYPVQSAYESVEVIAQTLNESYPLYGDRACSGTFLTNSVSGRKFNLTNGQIYVDKDGGRDIALVVYGFSLIKNSMQVCLPEVCKSPCLHILVNLHLRVDSPKFSRFGDLLCANNNP
jgi:hypothetical protein